MPRPPWPVVGSTAYVAETAAVITDLQTTLGDATAADLAKLNAVTASSAELNVLDGIPGTLTTTELGYVDGVTGAIQTQINRALGRSQLSLYSDFADFVDGSPSGVMPEIGPNTWLTSGAAPPTVSSGVLSSTGSGYLYTTVTANRFIAGVDASFGGTSDSTSLTIALCRTEAGGALLNHFAHCIYGPGGFTLTIRKDAGDFESILGQGWPATCARDGTMYRFGLMMRGNSIAVLGPFGEVYAVTDHRIADVFSGDTGTVMYQAGTGGAAKGYLHKAWALSRNADSTPGVADFIEGIMAGVLNARDVSRAGITGGYGNRAAVYTGPNSGSQPSVRFGSLGYGIIGVLDAEMGIGATTFVTDIIITGGSTVRMGIGNDLEVFTTSGYPTGTGPFTHTVTVAATKTHPVGRGFVAQMSGSAPEIYVSLGNGAMYLPSFLVLDSGNCYFGSALDIKFVRVAANVFGLADGDSFDLQGTHDGGTLRLRDNYLWVDATGVLRIKSSAPASDTDGTVVGAQT